MSQPTVEYGLGEINGQSVQTRITIHPPLTSAELALRFAAGQRTFGGGSVYIEFLNEPDADRPAIAKG